MTPEFLVSLIVPFAFLLLMMLEHRYVARDFVKPKLWLLKGIVAFLTLVGLSQNIPILLPLILPKSFHLLDFSTLHIWGAIPVFFVLSLVNYWLHRAEHHYDFLWRTFHQLHHSPTTVDIAGAFYLHPFEMMLKISISQIIASVFFNLTPLVIISLSSFYGFLSIFEHWNINTPRWLGFLIQRPESHCLHHEFEKHNHNYSSLPLWDMIFGTFTNPKTFEGKVGFSEKYGTQIKKMLMLKDVHKNE